MICSITTYVRGATSTKRGRTGGTLMPREALLARERIADRHGQRQRQVADVRERVTGIDRQRRQNGKYLVEELAAQLEVTLGPLVVADDADTLFGELVAHLGRLEVLRQHRQQPQLDRFERIASAHAVGRRVRAARLHVLLEASHPELEELVEVAGEDRQETNPLEQRIALVDGLVQDTVVELEPDSSRLM